MTFGYERTLPSQEHANNQEIHRKENLYHSGFGLRVSIETPSRPGAITRPIATPERSATQICSRAPACNAQATQVYHTLKFLGKPSCRRLVPGPDQVGYTVAFSDLAPLLSERFLGRAVEVVQELGNENLQAEALHRLAPYLAQKSIRQALAVARNMDDAGNRGHALRGLSLRLARLPASERNCAWLDAWDGTNLLRFLARRPRYHLLSDLAVLGPAISAIGGQQALEETRVAIEDVGHWWP